MAQTFRVIHVLVSGKPPKDRLPQHPDQPMPAVLTGSRIRERFPGHPAEAERIVEFAICEQPGVGGHHRTAKLEHQPAVEIEPERPVIQFTHRVRHDRSLNALISY